MEDFEKCIVETKYEKMKRLNIVVLSPILFFWIVLLLISGHIIDANLGEKWADIIVTCEAVLFLIFLAVYLSIYLIKMKKEKIEYAQFYRSLNIDSFYTKLDGVTFFDETGKRVRKCQVDRQGFRGGTVDIPWNDFEIITEEYYIKKQKMMTLIFVSKKDNSFFAIMPTLKNFYIIKNYCGQEIENCDELEMYVVQTSYINKL